MIVSLNEIETGCYRAALGVGLPQGFAQDAGVIGATLVATRSDGLTIMLRGLEFASASANLPKPPVFERVGEVWRSRQGMVAALVAGPIAADLRQAFSSMAVEIGSTDEPAIVAICLDESSPTPPSGSIEVDDELWGRLQRLGARTYVPASADSRAKGAGPGRQDHD